MMTGARFDCGLRIARCTFALSANFELRPAPAEPQPFGLVTNFDVSEAEPDDAAYIIRLEHRTGARFSTAIDSAGIDVVADFSEAEAPTANRQFGVMGNKGLVNRLVTVQLETAGIICLHGCALLGPRSGRVVFGIGRSGSGKTALVFAALTRGWKLLATELVLVAADPQFQVYRGNFYDNVAPEHRAALHASLPATRVFPDRMLSEPIGRRILVDFSSYRAKEQSVAVWPGRLDVAFLAHGSDAHRDGTRVDDPDFVLRTIQWIASEKVVQPVAVGSSLVDLPAGSCEVRSRVIAALLGAIRQSTLLGGDIESMGRWLDGLDG